MYYSANDHKALVGFLILIVILLSALWLFDDQGPAKASHQTGEDSLRQSAGIPSRPLSGGRNQQIKAGEMPIADHLQEGGGQRLFPFDPNTADSTALLRLGLSRWQVRNIYRYRSKGGIYRSPEDFSLLYGLSAYQYKRLLPYIRIASDYSMSAADYTGASRRYSSSALRGASTDAPLGEGGMTQNGDSMAVADSRTGVADVMTGVRDPRKLKVGQYVDPNHCDTSQLKRIPGIGSYYAKRIVRYREELGGFVNLSQLDEIEDFPKDAKTYMRIEKDAEGKPTAIRKLPINQLSINQLRKHPYLNFYQARAIVEYRRLDGPLSSLRELSNLPEFSESDFIRLEPYISYE